MLAYDGAGVGQHTCSILLGGVAVEFVSPFVNENDISGLVLFHFFHYLRVSERNNVMLAAI